MRRQVALALVLSLVLVFSLSPVAFAVQTDTLPGQGSQQVSNLDKHALSPDDAVAIAIRDLAVNEGQNPDAPRPDFSSDNAGFMSNRVISSPTPTQQETTELSFASKLKEADDFLTSVSDLLLVNGNVYVAVGQTLLILDGTTGERISETTLDQPIGFVARLLFSQGLVIVPLEGGSLQAFTADTLTSVWLTEALPVAPEGIHQNNSVLIEYEGSVLYGTVVADFENSFSGSFICVDIDTGTVQWQKDNATTGYYWAGAVVVNNVAYVADDKGTIIGIDVASGNEIGSVSVGASIRSALNSDGSNLFCSDTSGKLWKIPLSSDGKPEDPVDENALQFAASSTSSPVIAGNTLFVGGSTEEFSGVLAVIDLLNFTVSQSISVPGPVQSTPLVIEQDGSTYVYFTSNVEPGGMYCYQVGETQARELFTPEGTDANYCMASPVASSEGMLYYTNDSGQLFALADTNAHLDETPASEEAPAGSETSSDEFPLVPVVIGIIVVLVIIGLLIWYFKGRRK